MILQTMLQRLYASLASGPGLNARPHRSRQRLDLTELAQFQSTPVDGVLRQLLGPPPRPVDFDAAVPLPPVAGDTERTPDQREAEAAWERQRRLLRKLRDIAQDAVDYHHDHGDHALFIGFPLLSVPIVGERPGSHTRRLLAPALLLPVHLQVRRGPRAGIRLEPAGDGSDLLIPNPALMAWIEQQTGDDTDDLFTDDSGEEPWREVAEVLALATRSLGMPNDDTAFDRDRAEIGPVPMASSLPTRPALIRGAVLGLFPSANPGLLRDTKWMIDHEAQLQAPVRGFLRMETLASPDADSEPAESAAEPTATPAAANPVDPAAAMAGPLPGPPALSGSVAAPESTPSPAAAITPAAPSPATQEGAEWLVTRADPCQTEAVAMARSSEALVIHGPPGTGKSQTIANIIGDHLARGQRVLFVCDKRTALDVVKYRLDGMGLGDLCGIVHDPQRDRRGLYMGIRERLETLSGSEPVADPGSELRLHNERIGALRAELHACYRSLHEAGEGTPAFHDLCGQWLVLDSDPLTAAHRADPGDLTLEQIERHRADADEILSRAGNAGWPDNPLRGQVAPALTDWFGGLAGQTGQALRQARSAAEALDACQDPWGPLDPAVTPADQDQWCRQAASLLDELRHFPGHTGVIVARRLLTDQRASHWRRECDALAAEAEWVQQPLAAEPRLNLGTAVPGLAVINQHLATIDHWLGLNWLQRLLYFGARKAVRAALAAPGINALTPDQLQRARSFYAGLRARVLLSDLLRRLTGSGGGGDTALVEDEQLLALGQAVPRALQLGSLLEQPAAASVRERVLAGLAASPDTAATDAADPAMATTSDTAAALKQRASRAGAVEQLLGRLAATGLLTADGLAHWSRRWGAGEPASRDLDAIIAALPSVESLIRIAERLTELPSALAGSLCQAADAGLAWSQAEIVVRHAVLSRLLRERLQTDPGLARIDSQRIDAAFDELQQRIDAKEGLVRQAILHRWDSLWRGRLLAGTGSRLNPVGSALRQRLFIRGKRALKLRQMILAGETHPDGDPLFDLCPVWMASPATVAQIFPRSPQFDSVIFDEASQCRLEEALPTLLRGHRVVIAGDPKQLPPTRFFETALADSDDIEAETAEELFQAQQSGAEDLLAAALNLNVSQAFLDVHYRSRDAALIEFSNHAFYGSRLQPLPGHPSRIARTAPVRLIRVDGTYRNRTNPGEAAAAARLVAELLDQERPPSIGVACFNLTQRECILDALDKLAAENPAFAARLEEARERRGDDSFEGFFVKNLENVQGDERDHLIISTTFGPDDEGRFRRNFGALSRRGGERRLNVLVTRARAVIHVLTSIPEGEYLGSQPAASGDGATGRHYLYDYLRFAAGLQRLLDQRAAAAEQAAGGVFHGGRAGGAPSPLVDALGQWLQARDDADTAPYWGNDGFCIDLAVRPRAGAGEEGSPEPLGVMIDFNRYRKTPDPIAWERFRGAILRGQGWRLHRLWSPALFRDRARQLQAVTTPGDQLAGGLVGLNLATGEGVLPDLGLDLG